MFWVLSSSKRRRKLNEDAESARAATANMVAAWILVAVYNLVGFLDVASTIIAIDSGLGREANPLILAMMENIGGYWVLPKLALQAVVSAMVLWFPHWIVLGFFSLAMIGKSAVVYNNFAIAGVF